ncbi:MAG: SMI1/KNR4 family protein [Myxococcales bacterium]|nr:SMI1/KNR4 family protein [Myxococcales bacterium]
MTRHGTVLRSIDPDQIAWTEKQLGTTFPSAFKARMHHRNGGSFELDGEDWFIYPFRDRSTRKSLQKTADDILVNTRSLRDAEPDLPEGIVVLAHNGAGDHLVLLPATSTALGPVVHTLRLRGAELTATMDVTELPAWV